MFKKLIFVVTTVIVVGAFVACDRKDEQSSMSESVVQAAEKQMSPETSTNAQKDTEEEKSLTEKVKEKAEEATEAVKQMTSDVADEVSTAIPSIDENKLAPKPE